MRGETCLRICARLPTTTASTASASRSITRPGGGLLRPSVPGETVEPGMAVQGGPPLGFASTEASVSIQLPPQPPPHPPPSPLLPPPPPPQPPPQEAAFSFWATGNV